ncbi:MAG: hypothetical protein JWM11_6694 [Planctomycetaceae bacterium]|nr:hypothetical protein [Planctomycetaceae bacterium]
MRNWNWLQWLPYFNGVSERPAKRVLRLRNGWGIETEQLENRALLSAANPNGVVEHTDAADVGIVAPRKAQPVHFPSVQGTWNVTSTGEFSSSGTVTMTQNGAKVTSVVAIEGLETFTLVGRFKKKSPNELTAKSPRIAVPDFPVDVRLSISITFPQGNLAPTSFTGDVRAPFVGSVATLTGIKSGTGAAVANAPMASKAVPPPSIGGAWTVIISDIPTLGSLSGQLNLQQHGSRITGSADLGGGDTFDVRARISRKDPTQLSGRANVSDSQLGIKNAPFKVTLTANNTHFAGSVNTKVGVLHLDGSLGK